MQFRNAKPVFINSKKGNKTMTAKYCFSHCNGQPLMTGQSLVTLQELSKFLEDRLSLNFSENFWKTVFQYEKNKKPYNGSNSKSLFTLSDDSSSFFYSDEGFCSLLANPK